MMGRYVVRVGFIWGENMFSFPIFHEAETFMQAVLLCHECNFAQHIKEEPKETFTEEKAISLLKKVVQGSLGQKVAGGGWRYLYSTACAL